MKTYFFSVASLIPEEPTTPTNSDPDSYIPEIVRPVVVSRRLINFPHL